MNTMDREQRMIKNGYESVGGTIRYIIQFIIMYEQDHVDQHASRPWIVKKVAEDLRVTETNIYASLNRMISIGMAHTYKKLGRSYVFLDADFMQHVWED